MCRKIRCDGECEKIYKIFWEVNKALLVWLTFGHAKKKQGDRSWLLFSVPNKTKHDLWPKY